MLNSTVMLAATDAMLRLLTLTDHDLNMQTEGTELARDGSGNLRQYIYTTKIEECLSTKYLRNRCRYNHETRTSSTYCLDNDQTHFKTNFTVHFINFIKNNSANRDTEYPTHRPQKHARGRAKKGWIL